LSNQAGQIVRATRTAPGIAQGLGHRLAGRLSPLQQSQPIQIPADALPQYLGYTWVRRQGSPPKTV
jgi:hypothetical protein